MNLVSFMKQVDLLCNQLSLEQAVNLLQEIARTLPEKRRQEFLDALGKSAAGETVPESSDKELNKQVSECLQMLNQIENGKLYLESECNEEYDDWYNDNEDEYLFRDPSNLLDHIDNAIHLVYKCLDHEEYETGSQLAEKLSVLEVPVKGDCADYQNSSLNMEGLYQENLVNGEKESLVRESLYMTYMSNSLEERAGKMLQMMDHFGCFSVSMEQILQTGNMDLPQFDEFLPLWINELVKRKDYASREYLSEAMNMLSDEGQKLAAARKNAVSHPMPLS